MSTELNPRDLTVTAVHPPPEVLDGADEVQLVARAKNGCTAAFEQMIGRYESSCIRSTGSDFFSLCVEGEKSRMQAISGGSCRLAIEGL